MDSQNSDIPTIGSENIEEEMINFSELDELGLGEMEYYEDGNMGSEDIPYQLLDCEIAAQSDQQIYQDVGLDNQHLILHNEQQQIIENAIPDHMVQIGSQQHEQQIFQPIQSQSNDQINIYQAPVITNTKVETIIHEQNTPMYEFQQTETAVVSPVQKPETAVITSNVVNLPIAQKSSPVANVLTIGDSQNKISSQPTSVQMVVSSSSTSANLSQTVQHSTANTVKYVPFQTAARGQGGILLPKPGIVSGAGQALLIRNNSNQPGYLVQTPQGSLIFSGTPSTAPIQGSTQTVLVSASQSESNKLISPVITTINPSIVQNIPKTSTVQDNVQASKTGQNLISKPIFLLAPTAVKPGSVPANVMTFSSQPRMPSVAVRSKLQKIAPSPSKDQVMNKGSIQIGIQNNNKNVQFMVLDQSTETPQPASNSPKILTTNIQGVSKVMPIKTTKASMNLVQLVTPNNSKKMLLNLSPNTKFGTVVQPVSKPGLPPATTTTRVLMSYPRIRAPVSNNTSTVTATSRIIGTSAAREQNFRTISGTDANISSSKMFSQTVVRSAPTSANTSYRVFSTTNDDPRRKACNCNRSQCLKLYCECFANGEFCQNCNCVNCCNNLDHEEMRQKAIRFCLDRNPNAFHPKIGQKSSDVTHKKGCNCRRSGCLKNYCECYEAKILCTDKCKCSGCKNFENNNDRRLPPLSQVGMTVSQQMTQKHEAEVEAREIIPVWEPNPEVKLPFKVSSDMNPFNLLTDEILDATACCMIAQREEAENEGQDDESVERLTLEMFGDCLNQMFNLDANKKMNKSEYV